jgi:hypothetical protein
MARRTGCTRGTFARRIARAGGATFEPTLRLLGERLLLSGGARFDWADGFGSEVLPSAGLAIAPLPWLRARAQAGAPIACRLSTSCSIPTRASSRAIPTLAPEDAWNYDAGLEFELAEVGPFSDLKLGATWFRREIDESIVWLLVGPSTIRPVNTGSATADGYELSGSLRLTRLVAVAAQHTYVDSRRDANHRRLPGQPEHETFARLQLGPDPVWKVVGEVSQVGEILVSEGGSRRLPERTVWNASARAERRRMARPRSGPDRVGALAQRAREQHRRHRRARRPRLPPARTQRERSDRGALVKRQFGGPPLRSPSARCVARSRCGSAPRPARARAMPATDWWSSASRLRAAARRSRERSRPGFALLSQASHRARARADQSAGVASFDVEAERPIALAFHNIGTDSDGDGQDDAAAIAPYVGFPLSP